ncbi:MAG: 30S ribosomal protein S20 [Opitutales bacterium]
MANTKSAIKNMRKAEGQTLRNRTRKSRLKTLGRKVREAAAAGNSEETKVIAQQYISALDKAAKTKVIHENVAKRHKSACSKYIFTS